MAEDLTAADHTLALLRRIDAKIDDQGRRLDSIETQLIGLRREVLSVRTDLVHHEERWAELEAWRQKVERGLDLRGTPND